MSSHHIVRENQEPALIIADAHAISFEKIQELLEWMPTIVVVSTEVEQVIAWGIKVDVVIAPLAEIDRWRHQLTDQMPVRVISYNPGDDPITVAIYFLIAAKATAINFLLSNVEDLARIDPSTRLDMEAFTGNTLWRFIRTGHFEKWLPAGATLYMYPDERRTEFTQFATGSYPIHKDGIVSLKSMFPFWIGEQLD